LAVKLHPITLLLLLAVLLRLATDEVTMVRLSELLARPELTPGFTAIKTRAVSAQMADLAQTVVNLGIAAAVELLSRWAGQLKTARLRRRVTTGTGA
jgi:hypothetical protein